MEIEVTFDSPATVCAERADVALPGALEAVVEFTGGAVVQKRHASGQCEPAVRPKARLRVVVATFVKLRVNLDRFYLHRVKRNLVGSGCRRCGDDRNVAHRIRIFKRPFEHMHATHRAANDGVPVVDADDFAERLLRCHLVANG